MIFPGLKGARTLRRPGIEVNLGSIVISGSAVLTNPWCFDQTNLKIIRMKKSKKVTLVLAPILSAVMLVGCGGGEDEARDVYASVDDCLKDWNEAELCEKMDPDSENEYRRSHSGVIYPMFWGPRYYPSDRAVVYKGRDITPKGRSSSLTPAKITARPPSYSKSEPSSPRFWSRCGVLGCR